MFFVRTHSLTLPLLAAFMLLAGVGCGPDTADNSGTNQDMAEDWETPEDGDMSSADMSADMSDGEEDMAGGEADMETPQEDMGGDNADPGDMTPPAPDPCAQNERVEDGACVACEPGTENSEGDDPEGSDTSCDAIFCQENEYVDANACVACPAGTLNDEGDDASGADTACEAVICERNEYVDSNECVSCPGDTVNAAGDDASGPDTQCAFLCEEDEHVVDNTCVACPAGSINDEGDDPSGDDTSCDMVPCQENEYVLSNTCTACPAGTTNEAGDDSSGADTACDAVLCQEDEYVLSNTCTACPAGTVNAADDDASGADTACDAILCGDDEYVSSNVCTACPAGTINLAGDDASGADTSCDTIFCQENEYVSSNTCTACPADTVNEAGDDASGTDTACVALCAEDEYVNAGTCTACPGDSTNTSGDNPLAGDTTCDDECSLIFGVVCEEFHQAYIKASNTSAGDAFGSSVAIDGDRLVVGARYEDGCGTGVNPATNADGCDDSGAAYVYERVNGVWTQTALLKPSNTGAGDEFGITVSVDGDIIAVGSRLEDSCASTIDGDETDNNCSSAGAAYIFEYANGAWSQTAYIKPSNTDSFDNFGNAVSVSGNRVAIGSVYEDGCGTDVGADETDNLCLNPGAAFIFEKGANGWTQQAYFKSNAPGDNNRYAQGLSLDGDRLVVGAGRRKGCTVGATSGCNNAGAVYVYDYANGAWAFTAELRSSNLDGGDRFGENLDLDGDRLLITSRNEDSCATTIDGDTTNDACGQAGAAYLFELINGTWTQTVYFKGSATQSNAFFGTTAALDGDRILIGSHNEDNCNAGLNSTPATGCLDTGAAYLFEYANGAWSESAYLKSNLAEDGDKFGFEVSLSGDSMAITSNGEDSCAVGVDGDATDNMCLTSGAADVYILAP